MEKYRIVAERRIKSTLSEFDKIFWIHDGDILVDTSTIYV